MRQWVPPSPSLFSIIGVSLFRALRTVCADVCDYAVLLTRCKLCAEGELGTSSDGDEVFNMHWYKVIDKLIASLFTFHFKDLKGLGLM